MSSASPTPPWSVQRLPRADGRVFLVTGGNAGIGYFVAEQLSATGATVVLGSRNPAKAEAATASIRARVAGARVRAVRLDLAGLSSLRTVVEALGVDRLDAVVHNAGVALDDPPRKETGDGHELMFGTNHLGHFALTRWLMPLLSAAPAARVVTMGSFAAKSERLDLDDLQSRQDYRPKRTYGRSKLAQMYFGVELDRRLRAAGSTVASVVVHPGGALDSLTPSRPPVHVRTTGARLSAAPAALLVQGKHAGAWPAVRAVLDPAVRGGQLWGPRVFGLRGEPRREPVWNHLADPSPAARLWDASRDLTGVDPEGMH
ncbi:MULTISPECIES: SDR family NAD(P)-dependent oxidoreductase [unclassified Streptomyces]|uniref:SDR family NAD(P)-dependent oxidoreductase n=1 Tax=unclassified Streptomyces TaxID=2593676 RepID=UPI0008859EEE|nr:MULTISPECIES: SDR family NAD(P)-dependent oxidoreductase [unclassified Streptomyces]PBC86293.1 NADP-dependent 3-hydroxy acid dehydrogenase YdfG [Streptomyces sp. 2321.6]SDQ89739.1 NADP-dependent 3-hydroxy acid dehydrogenase YdfG [Streptomyces sp. KS_16]SED93905.1 NADP-dependent 3-hydroxy acid dehydrogenase YdfG [Streptomyces sp. 2133.1]SNC73174.1 NADP-dependent 3-hydroxy acid dehydrogenase YdfG [Streptomyces sp. 2114.4]